VSTIDASRCADADAAVVELLRAELDGVRILGAARWCEVARQTHGDDTYFGTVGFEVERSPARLEVALGYGAIVQLDAWLARRDQGLQSFVQTAMDPRLREIDVDRPSALVVDFARRLASRWLAIASNDALVLAAAWRWWLIDEPRDLGASAERWHGRSFTFDAHLSQLMSEPLGILELCAPASAITDLSGALART